MRTLLSASFLVGSSLLLVGCATTPNSTAEVSSNRPLVAAESPIAGGSSQRESTAASSDDVKSAEILRKAKSLGYHARVRSGIDVFCRTEATIGTRFPQETCIRPDQVEGEFERNALMKADMQSHQVCATGSCSTH